MTSSRHVPELPGIRQFPGFPGSGVIVQAGLDSDSGGTGPNVSRKSADSGLFGSQELTISSCPDKGFWAFLSERPERSQTRSGQPSSSSAKRHGIRPGTVQMSPESTYSRALGPWIPRIQGTWTYPTLTPDDPGRVPMTGRQRPKIPATKFLAELCSSLCTAGKGSLSPGHGSCTAAVRRVADDDAVAAVVVYPVYLGTLSTAHFSPLSVPSAILARVRASPPLFPWKVRALRARLVGIRRTTLLFIAPLTTHQEHFRAGTQLALGWVPPPSKPSCIPVLRVPGTLLPPYE